MDGNTDRVNAAEETTPRTGAASRCARSEHRDLTAAGVDSEREPPTAGDLDRALGSQPAPVPAPPALNGDPGSGVSDPSARRSNAAIVFDPGVLSSR